jgi:hypothetical protein
MRTPDIIEVASKVIEIFEKLNIGYYIGGSLASSAFGVARSTLDVDIVAEVKTAHASTLERTLKKEFYIDVDSIQRAIEKQSSFNLVHLETMFKIDVFILKDQAFHRHAFSRRTKKSVSEDISKQLYFPTPEDIVLIKLDWYKSGGESFEQQWRDVLGVLKVQGTKLNTHYLKHWADELSILDLLNKALEEAGVKEL